MRTTPSLVDLLERAVFRTVLLMVAAALTMGASQIGSGYSGIHTDGRVEVTRPPAPGSPRELIEEHRCWTREAPPDMVGEIAGHAVVTFGTGTAAYVGTNGVGQALEHVFEAKHPNITVHAFCR